MGELMGTAFLFLVRAEKWTQDTLDTTADRTNGVGLDGLDGIEHVVGRGRRGREMVDLFLKGEVFKIEPLRPTRARIDTKHRARGLPRHTRSCRAPPRRG
jgi:hypothetical protein